MGRKWKKKRNSYEKLKADYKDKGYKDDYTSFKDDSVLLGNTAKKLDNCATVDSSCHPSRFLTASLF